MRTTAGIGGGDGSGLLGGGGTRSEGNGRLRPSTNPRTAAGVEVGHDKEAQGRGPGLGHWTAHGKGGSGGGRKK